eukprot:PLAT2748.1.p1 GENE.PLAT2748.1~~PLAT2748.1.p1  ORF type:complete len:435 (-),score=169.46 PLAT2748.1:44-1348(-)
MPRSRTTSPGRQVVEVAAAGASSAAAGHVADMPPAKAHVSSSTIELSTAAHGGDIAASKSGHSSSHRLCDGEDYAATVLETKYAKRLMAIIRLFGLTWSGRSGMMWVFSICCTLANTVRLSVAIAWLPEQSFVLTSTLMWNLLALFSQLVSRDARPGTGSFGAMLDVIHSSHTAERAKYTVGLIWKTLTIFCIFNFATMYLTLFDFWGAISGGAMALPPNMHFFFAAPFPGETWIGALVMLTWVPITVHWLLPVLFFCGTSDLLIHSAKHATKDTLAGEASAEDVWAFHFVWTRNVERADFFYSIWFTGWILFNSLFTIFMMTTVLVREMPIMFVVISLFWASMSLGLQCMMMAFAAMVQKRTQLLQMALQSQPLLTEESARPMAVTLARLAFHQPGFRAAGVIVLTPALLAKVGSAAVSAFLLAWQLTSTTTL